MYRFRIGKDDLLTLLKAFKQDVKANKYKRFDYETWREIKNADNWEINFCDGIARIDEKYPISVNGIVLTAYDEYPLADNCKYNTFTFKTDDNQFGSFLQNMKEGGTLQYMNDAFMKRLFDDKCYSAPFNEELSATTSSCYMGNTDAITISNPWNDAALQTIEINGDVVLNGELKIRENKGDTKNMNNTGIKFDFGTCEKDNIRMSMYGIAVKNTAGEWVSYDAETGNVINVDIFNFNGGKYLFKMPVALKDIKKGDAIVHNKVPMYVSKVEDGKIFAIDPVAGEEKCILLTKNMFGFDFATKIVSLFDMGTAVAPSKDSPFGNMWPLLLADGNVDPLMMMAMSGGMKDMNPMMMYFLMNKDNNKDMGLLMAMSMMGKK